MEDLISIIVPVYNIEEYIEQCVESIFHQTYRNIEIILVDDGSTDNSGKICDFLAWKDARVRVLHNEHKGNAVARSEGYFASQGKYIGFVDGDDWIEPIMYEKMHMLAVQYGAQMVTSAGYREFPQGRGGALLKDNLPEGVYDMSEPDNLLLNNIFSVPVGASEKFCTNGAVWNKLYERDILTDIMQLFEDFFTFFEDTAINIGAILNASKIYIQHTPYYHHRERKGSIIYSTDERVYIYLTQFYMYIKKILTGSKYKEIVLPQLDSYMIYQMIRCIPFLLGRDCETVPYVFDADCIPYGSRIVLYGAGKVGKSYRCWLNILKRGTVVKWVDKSASLLEDKVEPVNSVKDVEFDIVLVAVKDYDTAEEIKRTLVKLTVDESKIVWVSPKSIANMLIMYRNKNLLV